MHYEAGEYLQHSSFIVTFLPWGVNVCFFLTDRLFNSLLLQLSVIIFVVCLLQCDCCHYLDSYTPGNNKHSKYHQEKGSDGRRRVMCSPLFLGCDTKLSFSALSEQLYAMCISLFCGSRFNLPVIDKMQFQLVLKWCFQVRKLVIISAIISLIVTCLPSL